MNQDTSPPEAESRIIRKMPTFRMEDSLQCLVVESVLAVDGGERGACWLLLHPVFFQPVCLCACPWPGKAGNTGYENTSGRIITK